MRWHKIRQNYLQHYLPWMYLIFMSGFFFFPEHKWHNNWFYLTIFTPFILIIPYERRIIPFSKLLGIFIFLSLYFFLQTFFYSGKDSILSVCKHILYVGSFYLVTLYLLEKYSHKIQSIQNGLIFLAAASALFSLFYFYYQHDLQQRLYGLGLLYVPVDAASLYAIAMLFALFSLFHTPSNKWLWVAISIFIIYIFFSQNRGTMVSLFVVGGVLLFLFKRYIALSVIVIFSIVMAVCILNELLPIEWLYRGTFRWEIWQIIFQKIVQQPWLGHSLRAASDLYLANGMYIQHPHNLYIATFYYGGIIGLGILITLLFSAIYQAYQWGKITKDYCFLALLLLSSTMVMFDYNQLFDNPQVLWFIFWVPIILANWIELQRKKSMDIGQR